MLHHVPAISFGLAALPYRRLEAGQQTWMVRSEEVWAPTWIHPLHSVRKVVRVGGIVPVDAQRSWRYGSVRQVARRFQVIPSPSRIGYDVVSGDMTPPDREGGE